jgi:hypothetical protein
VILASYASNSNPGKEGEEGYWGTSISIFLLQRRVTNKIPSRTKKDIY